MRLSASSEKASNLKHPIFMSSHYEKVRDFFEQSALRYRQHPKDYRRFYFQERLAISTQMLPAPPYRLLDVGCGNGVFYDYLSEIQQTEGYIGLDISPAMLALSHIPPAQQHLSSLEEYAHQQPSNSFDVLVALGLTTYYLPSDLAAFYQAIEQMLPPGGRAIISYTHAESWDFILRRRLHQLLGTLLPKKLSLGRSFPIYAASIKDVKQDLPSKMEVGKLAYLPAAIPFLTNLFPRLSVNLAKGLLKHAGKRWRADFVLCIHKK